MTSPEDSFASMSSRVVALREGGRKVEREGKEKREGERGRKEGGEGGRKEEREGKEKREGERVKINTLYMRHDYAAV